jgi:hypothetical protein
MDRAYVSLRGPIVYHFHTSWLAMVKVGVMALETGAARDTIVMGLGRVDRQCLELEVLFQLKEICKGAECMTSVSFLCQSISRHIPAN